MAQVGVAGAASEGAVEAVLAAASLQEHAAACEFGEWLLSGAAGCMLCAATLANTICRVFVKLCSMALDVTE